MVEQLFGSKTRVKLLQLFYSNPNRPFYVREITRKIDEQINSVRRELANLLSIGIISSDNSNNRLYYEVNQTFEYYQPLLTIFGSRDSSTQNATDAEVIDNSVSIKKDFKALGKIDLMVYTGQFTRDETTGVDVVIVGDINQTALQKFMGDLEKKEAKSIRYVAMKSSDFIYRKQINDRFVIKLIEAKKQVLIDTAKMLQQNDRNKG